MAADTISPEQTGMNVRLFMTANTLRWCSGNNLIGMAVDAVYGGVGSFQGKEIIMIEVIYQGVTAVMTGKTILAEQGSMIRGEIGLSLSVAVNTIYQIGVKLVLQMTIGTNQLRFVKIGLVPGQAEIGQAIMFEIGQRQKRDIGVPSFMLSVAGFTAAGVVQTAV
jgi:hypothetical protein